MKAETRRRCFFPFRMFRFAAWKTTTGIQAIGDEKGEDLWYLMPLNNLVCGVVDIVVLSSMAYEGCQWTCHEDVYISSLKSLRLRLFTRKKISILTASRAKSRSIWIAISRSTWDEIEWNFSRSRWKRARTTITPFPAASACYVITTSAALMNEMRVWL